jgi:hypothetical protein
MYNVRCRLDLKNASINEIAYKEPTIVFTIRKPYSTSNYVWVGYHCFSQLFMLLNPYPSAPRASSEVFYRIEINAKSIRFFPSNTTTEAEAIELQRFDRSSSSAKYKYSILSKIVPWKLSLREIKTKTDEQPSDQTKGTELVAQIPNFLSVHETEILLALIANSNFEATSNEYPKEYRSSTRLMVESETLSTSLWKRLVASKVLDRYAHIQPTSRFVKTKGLWVPYRVNGYLRISRYSKGQDFKAHRDVRFCINNSQCSLLSLVIYLNDDFTGGKTIFHLDSQNEKTKTIIQPQTGMAIVFPHAMEHAGEMVTSGNKIIMRADIMFQQCGVTPAEKMQEQESLAMDPLFYRVRYLFRESVLATQKGDAKNGTQLFLEAAQLEHEKTKDFTTSSSTSKDYNVVAPCGPQGLGLVKKRTLSGFWIKLSNDTYNHILRYLHVQDLFVIPQLNHEFQHHMLISGWLTLSRFACPRRHAVLLSMIPEVAQKLPIYGAAFRNQLKKDFLDVTIDVFLNLRTHRAICCIDPNDKWKDYTPKPPLSKGMLSFNIPMGLSTNFDDEVDFSWTDKLDSFRELIDLNKRYEISNLMPVFASQPGTTQEMQLTVWFEGFFQSIYEPKSQRPVSLVVTWWKTDPEELEALRSLISRVMISMLVPGSTVRVVHPAILLALAINKNLNDPIMVIHVGHFYENGYISVVQGLKILNYERLVPTENRKVPESIQDIMTANGFSIQQTIETGTCFVPASSEAAAHDEKKQDLNASPKRRKVFKDATDEKELIALIITKLRKFPNLSNIVLSGSQIRKLGLPQSVENTQQPPLQKVNWIPCTSEQTLVGAAVYRSLDT